MPTRLHEERRALLAATPLFSRLAERDLDAVVEVARMQEAPARRELFHKGDEGRQVYLILEGRLKAMTTSREGDDVVFSIMGPGEVFGELGLLGAGRRTATVVSLDPCRLLVIDRRDFLPLLRSRPELGIRLLEVLAERVQRISELLEDVQFLNLPSRLAKKLLALGTRYGEEADDGIRIDLRLSQTELGDLVATTRESVNKQIRTWADEGVVTMRDGYVTIHKGEVLEAFADLAGG